MAQFRPADHSKGDANTIGGYMAVHDRPAAFDGSDGFSYSVEIVVDDTEDALTPYAGYLLFVRWARIGAQAPEGHLETAYLAAASTAEEVRRQIGAMRLDEVKRALDQLVAERTPAALTRRWWDAMRNDGHGEPENGGSSNGATS
jgi:hypothetical protein